MRKERFPKENHQGFLLASSMRPTAAYHKLQLALQRVKSLFDTMKMPAEQFRRLFL
jgi:hypothetical protein